MKCCIISNLASSLSSSITCFLFLSHLRILQEFWQILLRQLNLISFISISFRKKSISQFDIFKLSIPCKHFHCVICISLQTPKSVTCCTRISDLHTVPLGVTLYNYSVSCGNLPLMMPWRRVWFLYKRVKKNLNYLCFTIIKVWGNN